MASITQDMRYRLSLIQYAQRHGVYKAAIKYRCNRQYIYRWLRRYDGTIYSLSERLRRPHSHKYQHSKAELKLIHNMRRRNPHAGLVFFWIKLRQRGYKRSITGFLRYYIQHLVLLCLKWLGLQIGQEKTMGRFLYPSKSYTLFDFTGSTPAIVVESLFD